jgi:hypothetical protein
MCTTSCQFLVAFILCGECIQTLVVIPYELKISYPGTLCEAYHTRRCRTFVIMTTQGWHLSAETSTSWCMSQIVYHKVHMLDDILKRGTEVQGNKYMAETRRWELSSYWVITQQLVAIPFRRFGTIYRSHLQEETPDGGTNRLSHPVGKKLPLLSCIITQKSAALICFAAEAWNHARRRRFSKT